jgi:beta-glucosidase
VDRATIQAGDDVTITLTVTNTGQRPGSDVVQIYLHDRTGVVLRPRRELAGFAKVRLRPGQSRTVTVPVSGRAFAFYDVRAADWRIPSGSYDLEVARSSTDVVDTATVTVKGGIDTAAEPADAPLVAVADEHFRQRLGHPIPQPRPVRPFTRQSTVDELSATRIGRLLKAVLWRLAPLDEATKADKATMAMLEHALAELPLRGVAIHSGGKLRWASVDILLDILNGRPGHMLTAIARTLGRRTAAIVRRR